MSLVRIVDGTSSDGSSRVQFVDSSYGQTSVMMGTAMQLYATCFNSMSYTTSTPINLLSVLFKLLTRAYSFN